MEQEGPLSWPYRVYVIAPTRIDSEEFRGANKIVNSKIYFSKQEAELANPDRESYAVYKGFITCELAPC